MPLGRTEGARGWVKMGGKATTGKLERGLVSPLHGSSATASSRPYIPCSTPSLRILGWQSHGHGPIDPGGSHEIKIPSVSTEPSKGCRAGGLKLDMVLLCGHSEKVANSVQRKQDSALSKLAQEKEGPGGEAVGSSYRWWWKTSQRQEGENGYFQDHKHVTHTWVNAGI